MKTATITLLVEKNVPMPESPEPFAAQAGFKLTLKRVSTGGLLELPVENKLVWVIGDFIEGEAYELLVESVDANGRVINAAPLANIAVPAAPTYTRVAEIGIDWS